MQQTTRDAANRAHLTRDRSCAQSVFDSFMNDRVFLLRLFED